MTEQATIQFPEELVKETLELLSKTQTFKKGANEVTKSLTRTIRGDNNYDPVKLIVIASDVEPREVTYHLKKQSKQAGIPYVEVHTQESLGAAIGIKRTAAVAVYDASAFGKIITNASAILGL